MNKAKLKRAAADFSVPQSRDDAVEAIARIGRHQRERQRIEADMNDELARVRQRYEEQAQPHAQAIRELSSGVHLWCEANRHALTQGGKVKFSRLPTGEVKWRLRPPSCSVRNQEGVIEALKAAGLEQFIRVKEEVNKDAVLADPESVQDIKGLTVTQKEDFVIVPFETELEEIA